MPGIRGHDKHATVEIEPYHYYREGKENNWIIRKERPILPSPVRSLLASLIKQPRRKKMATRVQQIQEDLSVSDADLVPAFQMATDWAEVVFFHQGCNSSSEYPLSVQGWRENTLGVSITPDWQPPSPVLTTTSSSRNPKNLLKSRLVQIPLFCDALNSHGDASEEEEEVEVEEEEDEEEEDEEDEELFQTPSWRPPAVPIMTSATKPLPLFSPSSPLSGCNIKHLLSSEKFQQLPKSAQSKLINFLPPSDIRHLSEKPSNGLDSVLNNEYISAALREWQDRLALGTLHRKRSRNHYETTSPWKEKFYEEYWGELKQKKSKTSDTEYAPFYPSDLPTPHQALVHDAILSQPTPNPTPKQGGPLATAPRLPTPPVLPLPVQLPLDAYRDHCTSQQITQEHSYCSSSSSTKSTLTLIIGSSCYCRLAPLQVCHSCHCLYHSTCGSLPRCPACSKR